MAGHAESPKILKLREGRHLAGYKVGTTTTREVDVTTKRGWVLFQKGAVDAFKPQYFSWFWSVQHLGGLLMGGWMTVLPTYKVVVSLGIHWWFGARVLRIHHWWVISLDKWIAQTWSSAFWHACLSRGNNPINEPREPEKRPPVSSFEVALMAPVGRAKSSLLRATNHVELSSMSSFNSY